MSFITTSISLQLNEQLDHFKNMASISTGQNIGKKQSFPIFPKENVLMNQIQRAFVIPKKRCLCVRYVINNSHRKRI